MRPSPSSISGALGTTIQNGRGLILSRKGENRGQGGYTKSNLPSKTCVVCGRPFEWRKKWADVWEDVKYCSDRCRGSRGKVAREAAQAPRGPAVASFLGAGPGSMWGAVCASRGPRAELVRVAAMSEGAADREGAASMLDVASRPSSPSQQARAFDSDDRVHSHLAAGPHAAPSHRAAASAGRDPMVASDDAEELSQQTIRMLDLLCNARRLGARGARCPWPRAVRGDTAVEADPPTAAALKATATKTPLRIDRRPNRPGARVKERVEIWDISAARLGKSPVFDALRESIYLHVGQTAQGKGKAYINPTARSAEELLTLGSGSGGPLKAQGSVAVDLLQEALVLDPEPRQRARCLCQPGVPGKPKGKPAPVRLAEEAEAEEAAAGEGSAGAAV